MIKKQKICSMPKPDTDAIFKYDIMSTLKEIKNNPQKTLSILYNLITRKSLLAILTYYENRRVVLFSLNFIIHQS